MKLKELFFPKNKSKEFWGHTSSASIEAYNRSPRDFEEGEVYEFSVAERSHVKKPYYVIIEDVGDDFIQTHVPDGHSLKINHNSYEWGYHIPRMRFIGDDEESRKLIYNQPNIITYKT